MENTSTEFGTYARFYSMEEAKALLLLLESNEIPFNVSHEVNQIDSIIIGNSLDPMIIVSIPPENFTEANQLVANSIEGIAGPEAEPKDDFYVPERLETVWIIFGYVLALFPLAGIFAGATLVNSYKRLSQGEKVKMYDRWTIINGRIILFLGILSTIRYVVGKFYGGLPF
jgi:hypothetical protein